MNGQFIKKALNLQGVSAKLQVLKEKLAAGDFDVLEKIRKTVLELVAPPQLVTSVKLLVFQWSKL